MGFSVILILLYVILFIVMILLLKQNHKRIAFEILLFVLISIVVLGYLWIHSPM